jgi:diguanylate cyclase (GGDEF)-like protein/PAS domain S-box-containing protein
MNKNNSVRHILAIELNGLRKTIFLDKNTYSVGRNSTNSIVLHHKVVSRNHANLLKVSYKGKEKNKDVFWLIDGDLKGNRSTNGIFVNGKRCFSQELKPGDSILFGGVEVRAKYDILDVNSQTLLSILKDKTQENNSTKLEPLEEGKTTFVPEKEIKTEPLTEEFLAKINLVKDLLPYPIVEINLEGKITDLNSSAEQNFQDLIIASATKLSHPITDNLANIFQTQQTNLLIREIKIGSDRYTQYAHCLDDKKLIRSYLLDDKKRQQLNLTLRESEERYRSLVKQITEGIFLLDTVSKKILDANPAYCELLGYSSEEITELSIYDLVSIDRDILQQDLQKIIEERIPFVRESIHRCKDGSLVNVEVSVSFIFYAGKEVLCFAVRDITDRKRTEEILRYQSSHDLLTNLPNQRFFTEQLSTALANAKNSHQMLALMFIKLKRFKTINYSLGHNFGDQLLQSFAKRIKSCLRSGDTIARWGGDEFTILVPEVSNTNQVANISQMILEQLNEPFLIGKKTINLTVSIGIALYPNHGNDTTTLLKNADSALYHTQKKRGNKYQFYLPNMNLKAQERFTLENQLYQALKKEAFTLLYQPEINSLTGEVTCLKVTPSWSHPKLGNIPPEEFLSIAEETNLIIPLNKWMIKTACQQHFMWQQNQIPVTNIAVPLSPRYLEQSNFLAEIAEILTESNLDPNFLELDIQEKDLTDIWVNSRQNLKELWDMGVNISLDNFGQGSSLTILSQCTIKKVRIAENFVKNIENERENLALISAILTLALAFNITVVNKGVSNKEQLELLQNLQCEEMQGTLFSSFLNTEAATNFLSGKHQKLTKIVNEQIIFDLSQL